MGHQRSLSSSSCFFSSSFRVIQRFRRGREITTHFTSTQENATPHTHTLNWGLYVHSCTFIHSCIFIFRLILLTQAPFF